MKPMNRRDFMKTLGLTSVAFLTPSFLKKALAAEAKKGKAIALPAGQSAASESDPVASAIGYKANPKDVDLKKYPQFKKPEAKGQACKNCALYVASNEGWGKCQMITNGLVAAEGWCGSYSKKK